MTLYEARNTVLLCAECMQYYMCMLTDQLHTPIYKICTTVYSQIVYIPVEVFVESVENKSQQFLGVLLLESIESRSTSPHRELMTGYIHRSIILHWQRFSRNYQGRGGGKLHPLAPPEKILTGFF